MDPSEIAALLARKAELETRLNGFEIWLIVFGICVAVGVVGESVFGFRAWWNNRKLHTVQSAIDRQRDFESAQQRERTATAERMLLEVQERLQDRTFNNEQHTRLVNMLGVGARCGVQVIVGVGNDEASRFAKRVLDILHEAGWTAEPFTIAQTSIESGIGLANIKGDPADPCTANLWTVFDSVGMRPKIWKGDPDGGAAVQILIGPKPHP
jgi:hypothetical protein